MFKDVILYSVKSLLIAVLIITIGGIGHSFILETSEVNGRSMENTFHDQDIIVINKLPLLIRTPKRGDLVSAFDEFEELLLVKRVVGLPGEQIVLKDGYVFVRDQRGNEFLLDEPYVKEAGRTTPKLGVQAVYPPLGPNEYFLMGDNRENSTDSRYYGGIPRKRIVGLINKLPF